MNMSDKDLLNYALENGMIDLGTIQKTIEMNERKKYIEKHNSKIWQGSNGKWYTYLPDESKDTGRRMIKKNTKEQIYDSIVEYYKQQEHEPYIKDVFYAWAKTKLEYGEILNQTYDRYETDFIRFFDGTEISKIKFRFITEDMLEDFIKKSIRKHELTAKAWGNLRTIINGIFKYGKKKGYTKISIAQFMGDIEISPKTFKKTYVSDEESVFTDKEVKKIVDYIQTNKITIINLGIILAFQTGLRAGELSALQFTDVDGNILHIRNTEVRYKDRDNGKYIYEVRTHTKGKDGYRNVILTDNAVKTIKQIHLMNPFGQYLFERNGKRIKAKSFTVKIEKICDYVGIGRRSLHKARKTYATKLLNAGIDEKLIEKQMGHTDIRTTKGYYYFNNREIDEAKELITSAIV